MTKNSFAAAGLKGLSLFLCFSLACPASLRANPVGGVVVGGDANATITYGGLTTINQTASRAVIDWTSFSITPTEVTHFNQPDALSAVLNRVTGGDPSSLMGSLTANGSVFLINPNGILVGLTGSVNTNGFVASTLDVANADFLAGGDLTFSGNSTAGVVNANPLLRATDGDVVLIARTVSNSGTITANEGTVALAAGSEVLYKPLDEERVFVQAGLGSSAVGVDQAGTIQAAAAELKAAGGNVYSLAINNSGTINADQVAAVGGRIYLTAESGLDSGAITNSGTLTATKGVLGGEVLIAGDQITLEGFSSIGAADLQLTADTGIRLDADVVTDGSQTYSAPVVLGGYRTLSSAAGDITFNGSVDSADTAGVSDEHGLSVTAASGLVSFNGAVGGVYALGDLDVSAAQIGLNADVTTAGYQTYTGPVDVGADAVLTAGDYAYFDGTVDSANLSSLTVTANGEVEFTGDVGATALGDLTVASEPGSGAAVYFDAALDSDGSVVVNSDGITEFYGDAGSRALGDLSVTSEDYIWFYGTLDSSADAAVTLITPLDVGFDMAVGAASLGDLTVDSRWVDFSDTLDSDGSVAIDTSIFEVMFNGNVGSRALDDLSVTSPDIRVGAGTTVETTGAQSYAGPVTSALDASFISNGGAIDFLGVVDTSGNGLSVDAGAGAVTFGEAVTAGNLTVAGGDVRWDGSLSGADVLLTGTNLIMNGDVNSTGANGVVMVAANSFDNTSASAIDPGAARWLIYSSAPGLDVAGGLAGGAARGVSHPDLPSFAGNGFVYSSVLPAAADQPAASELENFAASMVPPPVLVAAGGESMVVDGAAEAAPGEFGSDDGGSDGGSSGDSESGDGEKEKDGDE